MYLYIENAAMMLLINGAGRNLCQKFEYDDDDDDGGDADSDNLL